MSSRARERRITLMMGTITVVFIFCVAPYFIYFLAPGKPEAKEQVLPYIVMLMYLNSVINPLLYISMNSSVRKATLMMFSCKKAPEFLFGERYFVATAYITYIRNVFFVQICQSFLSLFQSKSFSPSFRSTRPRFRNRLITRWSSWGQSRCHGDVGDVMRARPSGPSDHLIR